VPSEGFEIEKPRTKQSSSRTRTKPLVTKSIDSFQMDRIERVFPGDGKQAAFDGGIDLAAISLASQLSRYPLPMPSGLESKSSRKAAERAPEPLMALPDDFTFTSTLPITISPACGST
jgi:hypothetical protein